MIPFRSKSVMLSMLIDLLTSRCRSTQVKLYTGLIASIDLWPQEMFTFSEMLALALVQSDHESSFGAHVCHRRPAGLHGDQRSCVLLHAVVANSVHVQAGKPMFGTSQLQLNQSQGGWHRPWALTDFLFCLWSREETSSFGNSTGPLCYDKLAFLLSCILSARRKWDPSCWLEDFQRLWCIFKMLYHDQKPHCVLRM